LLQLIEEVPFRPTFEDALPAHKPVIVEFNFRVPEVEDKGWQLGLTSGG